MSGPTSGMPNTACRAAARAATRRAAQAAVSGQVAPPERIAAAATEQRSPLVGTGIRQDEKTVSACG